MLDGYSDMICASHSCTESLFRKLLLCVENPPQKYYADFAKQKVKNCAETDMQRLSTHENARVLLFFTIRSNQPFGTTTAIQATIRTASTNFGMHRSLG
jgi:hypothetical protein